MEDFQCNSIIFGHLQYSTILQRLSECIAYMLTTTKFKYLDVIWNRNGQFSYLCQYALCISDKNNPVYRIQPCQDAICISDKNLQCAYILCHLDGNSYKAISEQNDV
jgi:hypothetical protein